MSQVINLSWRIMNKEEFINAITSKTDAAKVATKKFLNAFVDVVTETLKKGGDIRLVGFGTFKTTKRKATTGRNPRTGAKINISSSTKAKFKPGKLLSKKVNNKQQF